MDNKKKCVVNLTVVSFKKDLPILPQELKGIEE